MTYAPCCRFTFDSFKIAGVAVDGLEAFKLLLLFACVVGQPTEWRSRRSCRGFGLLILLLGRGLLYGMLLFRRHLAPSAKRSVHVTCVSGLEAILKLRLVRI